MDDIKKYLLYKFHNYLLRAGGLTEIEYGKAVSEKRFIWESYILKKYDAGVVERIRSSALSSPPVPEWDVSLYKGGYE